MRVLGIETSCDECGIAVYEEGKGILAETLRSQIAVHAPFGGVVPELASRDHIRHALPLLRQVLGEAGLTPRDLGGIAWTAGPGLAGALLVGAGIGAALAFALDVPGIGIHHLEGHLLAVRLEPAPPEFPWLALLVSGGHTLLVEVSGIGRYRVLGESLDDAAGEAFDKTAKLLGLPYPGGPALAALALQGHSGRFAFPRPMTDRPGLDFSFSGLKTHALVTLRNAPDDDQTRADIARAFEEAVVDTLVIKCRRALEATGLDRLVIAGGVGANQRLREALKRALEPLGARVHYPRPSLCTDNGAMIAHAGALRLMAGEHSGPGFGANPRWGLEELG